MWPGCCRRQRVRPTSIGGAYSASRPAATPTPGVRASRGAARLPPGSALSAMSGPPPPAARARAAWREGFVRNLAPAPAAHLADVGGVRAWVVGGGLGTDEHAGTVVRNVLATALPVLVDADALTVLAADPAPLRDRRAPT